MKRRDFIKKSGKIVLATTTISITGITLNACSTDDPPQQMCDGYYVDGYYTDGYYTDGYYSGGYYTDGYYTDGYYVDGYPC